MNFNDLLYYDTTSKTGLRWKVTRNNRTVKDSEAGCLDNTTGYYRISVDSKLYYCHRVVWILHNGDIDKKLKIDHIDGNKTNNNIDNIRVVHQQLNVRNRGKSRANKSGIVGVFFDKYAVKPAWVANWHSLEGKRCNKKFLVSKHGDENAFILAWEYRKKMIHQLNELGAGYAERHGK